MTKSMPACHLEVSFSMEKAHGRTTPVVPSPKKDFMTSSHEDGPVDGGSIFLPYISKSL